MNARSRPTLLVGSVALGNARDVLLLAGGILGASLKSVPDGETGERLQWYSWQEQVFARAPFLKKCGVEAEFGYHRFSVAGSLQGADFGNLGYADAALASYEIFKSLRAQGRIASTVRFQVSLPPPIAPLSGMIDPADFLAVEPVYGRAMRAEIEKICRAIPAQDLAIQWDLAQEVGVLEGLPLLDGKRIFTDPLNDMLTRVAALASWVPEPVTLGFHLCYGDYQHKHWMEPKDTGVMVELANGIFASVSRPVDWIHLPVPRDRDDDAYFEPLRRLLKPATTQLYLGLVHYTDGLAGARRRLAAAERHVKDEFGVATECGLGRRPPETIPDVMRLMAAVAGA